MNNWSYNQGLMIYSNRKKIPPKNSELSIKITVMLINNEKLINITSNDMGKHKVSTVFKARYFF